MRDKNKDIMLMTPDLLEKRATGLEKEADLLNEAAVSLYKRADALRLAGKEIWGALPPQRFYSEFKQDRTIEVVKPVIEPVSVTPVDVKKPFKRRVHKSSRSKNDEIVLSMHNMIGSTRVQNATKLTLSGAQKLLKRLSLNGSLHRASYSRFLSTRCTNDFQLAVLAIAYSGSGLITAGKVEALCGDAMTRKQICRKLHHWCDKGVVNRVRIGEYVLVSYKNK